MADCLRLIDVNAGGLQLNKGQGILHPMPGNRDPNSLARFPPPKIAWYVLPARLPFPSKLSTSGSFARGRCRRGRSEIHVCSKLQFALVLWESKRKKEKDKEKQRKTKKKRRKKKKNAKKSKENGKIIKNKKRAKFLRPHLHQPH